MIDHQISRGGASADGAGAGESAGDEAAEDVEKGADMLHPLSSEDSLTTCLAAHLPRQESTHFTPPTRAHSHPMNRPRAYHIH